MYVEGRFLRVFNTLYIPRGGGVNSMYGLILVGDSGLNVEDIYRLLTALAIAYRNGIHANVTIGKDVSLNIGSFKFDYVLYRLEKIPIDIKILIKNEQPLAIVEDSTVLKRLESRQREIENLLIQHGISTYYMHVTTSRNKEKENVIIKLIEKNPQWYVLEIST